MNSILILGGNGFIGKNLIERFLFDIENYIIILTRKGEPVNKQFANNSRIKVVYSDLNDIRLVFNTIEHYKVNVVVHLISTLIPSSNMDEFHLNIDTVLHPTFKLIDYLSNKNIQFVFFSSGGTIYGNSNKPLKEDSLLNPINYYGYSKLMIEQYILFRGRESSFNYLIIRPSNAYGKYQRLFHKQGLIAIVTNKIIHSETIEIWGDGNIIRDYVNILDLVDAVYKLINMSIRNEIINIGSGVGTNQLEIVRIVEDVLGKKADIVFKEKRPIDVEYMVLNIAKLKSLISYQPILIKDGISSFIKDVTANEKQ